MESAGYIRGASELINIREFIQKWDPTVIPGISEKDKKYMPMRDVLVNEIGVERPTVGELENVCRLEKGEYSLPYIFTTLVYYSYYTQGLVTITDRKCHNPLIYIINIDSLRKLWCVKSSKKVPCDWTEMSKMEIITHIFFELQNVIFIIQLLFTDTVRTKETVTPT